MVFLSLGVHTAPAADATCDCCDFNSQDSCERGESAKASITNTKTWKHLVDSMTRYDKCALYIWYQLRKYIIIYHHMNHMCIYILN